MEDNIIIGSKEWGERSKQDTSDIAIARFEARQNDLIKIAQKYAVGVLVNEDGAYYGTIYSKDLPIQCISALQWRQATRTNSQNIWDQFRIAQ